MARKKHAEEHENLERWLVSYADFMTLLFATFVVLYALAQTDVNSFKNIEEALKRAFSQNIFDNQASIMSGSDSILEGYSGATNPLMLEYMSQKYETSSYEEIKKEVADMKEQGITAEIDERGLVIRMSSQAIEFKPATAELTEKSQITLGKVAELIKKKFSIHYIQVEGHTDSDPISSSKYPSNWELSSARASSVIRHLISRHNFNPKIFIAAGLADTIPIVENSNPSNKAKNRRVEIVVLKNKHKFLSKKDMQQILKEAKMFQKKTGININETTKNSAGNDKDLMKNVIDMTNTYESEAKRLNSLDDFDFMHDGLKPDFMEQ